MARGNSVRILILADEGSQGWKPLKEYFQKSQQVQVDLLPATLLPTNLGEYRVLLLISPENLTTDDQERLRNYLHQGGGCLAFVGSSPEPLPLIFGTRIHPSSPDLELRVQFADPSHPIARRLPAKFMLQACLQPLEPPAGKSEPILTTMRYCQPAILALLREEGAGRIAITTLRAFSDFLFQQMIYRVVRHLARLPDPEPVRVAILGYGPLGSVGYLHALAVQEVPGLDLRAFCDYSPDRLLKCREEFPGCRGYENSRDLARDPEVDLVIIATPPNSHAELAIQFLREGKHVVCEKPMCLTRREAEAMIQAAEETGRVLSSYQNRRWDPDYLAIRQALQEGAIGDPFYLETFVGDFNHPCHFWHSHAFISGDALFDWGAHCVDWVMNLFPGPTALVTGTRHKRVWQDVTNADQMRAHLLFADGREADFLYSDVAALRKPKWYLLGTEGAIIGEWQEISLREADPIMYHREDPIPVTEAIPLLKLRRRHPSGTFFLQQLPIPELRRFPFHYNLADHLLTGEPLAVTARSAARVVAVLEAATRSASKGGIPEVLCV